PTLQKCAVADVNPVVATVTWPSVTVRESELSMFHFLALTVALAAMFSVADVGLRTAVMNALAGIPDAVVFSAVDAEKPLMVWLISAAVNAPALSVIDLLVLVALPVT